MESTLHGIGPELLHAVDTMDTDVKRLNQQSKACRLPERPGISAELNAEIAEHHDDCDEFGRRCSRSHADLKEAIGSSCSKDEIGELLAATEAMRTDGPLLAQDLVRLATRKVELADKVVVELKLVFPELAKKAEAVVANVKEKLEELGCGVEAQQGWSHGNKLAAERQFDNLARNVNLKSRAALAAAADARAEWSGALQTAGEARHQLDAARKTLVAIAKKAIAGR